MVPSCFSSPQLEDKVDFGIWIPLLYSRLLLTPALPCIFSVHWKALFAHIQHQCILPCGNGESSTQHQASLFPKAQKLLLPLGPQGLCVTFTGCWGRELSHAAS